MKEQEPQTFAREKEGSVSIDHFVSAPISGRYSQLILSFSSPSAARNSLLTPKYSVTVTTATTKRSLRNEYDDDVPFCFGCTCRNPIRPCDFLFGGKFKFFSSFFYF